MDGKTILSAVIAIASSKFVQEFVVTLIDDYIEEERAVNAVRHSRACCLCGSSARQWDEGTNEVVPMHAKKCPGRKRR